MKPNSLLVLFIACILFGACSTLSSRMESWVGKDRDELIKAWGPPSQEIRLKDEGRSMVYITQGAVFSGEVGRAWTCRMIFNTNSNDIITSWSRYGC